MHPEWELAQCACEKGGMSYCHHPQSQSRDQPAGFGSKGVQHMCAALSGMYARLQ